MKKLLVFIMAFLPICLSAQVKLSSLVALDGTANKGFTNPKFSPVGNFLLLTTDGYKGLYQFNFTDKSLRQLTNASNAGYEAQVSDGGKIVVFRDVEYIDSRRYTSIKQVNTESGEITELAPASREKYSFNFAGGTIRIAQQHKIISRRVLTDIRPIENKYVVAVEDMNLVLYVNNVRHILNPQGDGSYIWPSISPDQKHIVYTLTRGNNPATYVCNIDGTNPVSLGYLAAPQWLGNNYILGMLDLWNDGYQYTRSPLVTQCIDGSNRQIHEIEGHEVILYPAASPMGDKIAFADETGVYTLNATIQ